MTKALTNIRLVRLLDTTDEMLTKWKKASMGFSDLGGGVSIEDFKELKDDWNQIEKACEDFRSGICLLLGGDSVG